MADSPAPPPPAASAPPAAPGWMPRSFHPFLELNRYHWWVLLMCILGWMFDTMDQRLFVLARDPAMTELVGARIAAMDDAAVMTALEAGGADMSLVPDADAARERLIAERKKSEGRASTLWFIWGWATGGIFFGVLGDKIGRAKTMMLTILAYALFTALSGLSRTVWEFHACRFLTGLGVGGEFAAGVALLSEVIPERARPISLGLMQGLSAAGNITGSLIGIAMKRFSWRWLFAAGAVPALLAVIVRRTLHEPETWVEAKRQADSGEGRALGSYRELFGHRRWRRNAIVGVAIAVVGVTGVWGIGFYTPELVTDVYELKYETSMKESGAAPEWVLDGLAGKEPTDQNLAAAKGAHIAGLKAMMPMFQDIGAFFSMFGFAIVSDRIGRKNAFLLCCLSGFATVAVVFGLFENASQLWWMGILLGLGIMGIFGGYAVYFAELFPTRLRSTGVSLCYNVARFFAGPIQLLPNLIHKKYVGRFEKTMTAVSPRAIRLRAYRWASVTMASVYFVGVIAILFGPETAGRPLPTDEDEESLRS